MRNRPQTHIVLSLVAAALVAAVLVATAGAKMRSERVSAKLCVATGGGKFVAIPGFPGEKIDRRLLRDIRWLVRKYKIFITDGYSLDPVHARNGEHPIGLALDIVPDRSKGGTWRDVDRLARWAEPQQNRPRAPFRWVGYDGDSGHGRGHHLHLSYSHSPTPYNTPARTVYSIKCLRGKKRKSPERQQPDRDKRKTDTAGSGGLSSGGGTRSEPKTGSGGFEARRAKRKIRRQQRASRHRESGGVGVR